MNDPRNRFLFMLLLYFQYILQCNNSSISALLFSWWHVIRVESQAAIMKRKLRVRTKWSDFHKLLSSSQFHRYFRMEKSYFKSLCNRIEASVGKDVFLSERFLNGEIGDMQYYRLHKMKHAHEYSTGGFISGEIKVAITLRLLSGASYQDLGLLFVTSYSNIYRIFHYVIENWINNDGVMKIDCYNELSDVEAMKKAAKTFATHGKNEGIFGGIIACLDGWLVKIKCPMLNGDCVKNQGSFFCTKGYYAINVQAMVNRHKMIV